MKAKLIVIALILTGCATSKQTYAPDGGNAFSLDCSGTARNWGMCYEKAGELCKEKGYTVVAGGSDSDATMIATNQGAFASSKNNRSMLIKCK